MMQHAVGVDHPEVALQRPGVTEVAGTKLHAAHPVQQAVQPGAAQASGGEIKCGNRRGGVGNGEGVRSETAATGNQDARILRGEFTVEPGPEG